MVSVFVQLRWLLWKNWIIIKRRYIASPLEFLIPALLPVIMLLIRQRVDSHQVENPQFYPECSHVCSFPNGGDYSSLIGIVYYPNSEFTDLLMERVVTDNPYMPQIKTAKGGFASEEAMVDFLIQLNASYTNTRYYAAGIVFSENVKNRVFPTAIQYKIRMPATFRSAIESSFSSTWKTKEIFPTPLPTNPREKYAECSQNPNYRQEGFTSIQCAINAEIINMYNGTRNGSEYKIVAQRNPFPPYYKDPFILAIQENVAFMLVLGFFFTVLNAASDVTAEREDKLKETLRMMGVDSSTQWAAWIIRFVVSSVIICSLQTLFFCLPTPGHPPVFPKSDPSIVLIFLLLSCLASISFGFMISSIFSSASSAAVATAIAYLMSYSPYSFLTFRYGDISLSEKMAAMLISTVGMGFGGLIIGDFEALGKGAQWNVIYQPVSVDDELTLNLVFIMLIVDIILYCLIAFYIEAVFPGDFGVPQPWYFPFSPSFWCPSSTATHDSSHTDHGHAPVPDYADKAWFEKPSGDHNPSVKVRKLTRKFKNKTAVDSLSLDLYDGHVTCLLGHNGSGKTTTMFMLTGFLAPTSGTALINDFDIRKGSDLSKIRHQLGLCPQHDVLFRQLTVSEHLKLFALLKGCSTSDVKTQIEEALSSVNLKLKRNEYARNMSGGQKRRLSVAIALIGDTKIVILDEPTSGLDPDARHALWDVIEAARPGRAILLTTHFLEEADALADRIAVLSSGKLKCVGSPMFLKRNLGGGYRLNIEMTQKSSSDTVDSIVRCMVPNAKLWSQTLRNELLYTLPTGDEESNMIPEIARLMDELEGHKKDLDLESLGLTASSMEDVFVAAGLAEEFNEGKEKKKKKFVDENDDNQTYGSTSQQSINANSERLTAVPDEGVYTGPILWLIQLWALFVKHAIAIYRSPIVLISQMGIPLFSAAMAVWIISTIPGLTDSPELSLTPDMFYQPKVTIPRESSPFSEAYRRSVNANYPSSRLVQPEVNQSIPNYLVEMGTENLPDYRLLYNFGVDFEESEKKVIAYFNGEAYHSIAVGLGMGFSGLLNLISSTNYSDPIRLETSNHPLPPTALEQADNQEMEQVSGFILSFNIMFGMAIYMGCCVLQPVGERMCQAKHLQMMAGTSPWVYWLAMFISQLLLLIPSVGLILALFAIADFPAFVAWPAPIHFFLILIMFFVSAAPQNYLLSLLFERPNRALIWLILWNMLAAEVTIMAVIILKFPSLKLQDLGNVLEVIFIYLLPQYNAGQALQDYYNNYIELSICTPEIVGELCPLLSLNLTNLTFPCCPPPYCSPGECWNPTTQPLSISENGVGENLIVLSVQGVLYTMLLLLIEYKILQKIYSWIKVKCCYKCATPCNKSTSRQSLVDNDDLATAAEAVSSTSVEMHNQSFGEDPDVIDEKRRVKLALARETNSGLLVSNVVQRFSSTVLAVGGVSFQVEPGQCFGLLGFNGAGKTTLYRIITSDLLPTNGDVFVAGYSVTHSPTYAQSQIGYCPQAVSSIDGLLEMLTGRQQLTLMARLRGIRGDISGYVKRLLDLVYLSRFADRTSKTYSGGMRRKLSTALSLVGQPPIVLLDEPTTGMDPAARRQFWRVVDQLRRDGSTVVMTSHSMDECDLLCSKIAVMVQGRLVCIGPPSHLKSRFGGGMILVAKAPSTALAHDMMEFIEGNIVNAVRKDAHLGTATYTISYVESKNSKSGKMAQTWSQIFGLLERGRRQLRLIEDYSLSHATLERVFLSFASGSLYDNAPAGTSSEEMSFRGGGNSDESPSEAVAF